MRGLKEKLFNEELLRRVENHMNGWSSGNAGLVQGRRGQMAEKEETASPIVALGQ